MKVIEYNSHVLEMYDSVEGMPVLRFQKYNRSLMLDSGIGSDIGDLSRRLSRISGMIDSDPAAAKKEVSNTQHLLRFVVSDTNPKQNAFACLIHKINGRLIKDEDLTDEGIKAIIKELSKKGISQSIVVQFLESVKKKLKLSSSYFFPN